MYTIGLMLLSTCAHPRPSGVGRAATAPSMAPVVFTASNRGELRPCGCPGAVFGGLAKRATMFAALTDELGAFSLVDAGDLLFPEGPVAEVVRAPREAKARGILGVYDTLGYDVVAETPLDLRASSTLREDPLYSSVERGPGVYRGRAGHVFVVDEGVIPDAPAILLTSRLDGELADVAARAPSLWAIVSSSGEGSVSEPSVAWAGDVPILRPTPKGKEFGVLWMWKGEATTERAQSCTRTEAGTTCELAAGSRHYRVEFRRVPRETADEPVVNALLSEAERSAAIAATLEPWQEWQGRTYVSAGACAACHVAEAAQWETTLHARAWESLTEDDRKNVDCVGCHATGYTPEGGFVSPAAVGLLAGVQCEVCHGPGLAHVYDPRQPVRRLPTPDVCLGCHQWDRSKPFDYLERLPHASCTGHGLSDG